MNLKTVIKSIDAATQPGYAEANPQLLAAYILADAIKSVDETLAETINILTSKNPLKFLC